VCRSEIVSQFLTACMAIQNIRTFDCAPQISLCHTLVFSFLGPNSPPVLSLSHTATPKCTLALVTLFLGWKIFLGSIVKHKIYFSSLVPPSPSFSLLQTLLPSPFIPVPFPSSLNFQSKPWPHRFPACSKLHFHLLNLISFTLPTWHDSDDLF